MRPVLLLAAALAATACQPAPADGRAPPPPVAATGAAPVAGAPAALMGEYRVAGIDGTEVAGKIGIALTITERQIHFDPRCAGFNWTYTYADGVLATARPGKPRAEGAPYVAGPPAPVCAIAIHPEQARLQRALDAVTRAARTPANGIELSGGGHSVTLFSQ